MCKAQYTELVSYIGLRNLPKELEQRFASWIADDGCELLRHGYLDEVLARFDVPASVAKPLWDALEEIENDQSLLQFSRFLIADMCDTRWRGVIVNYDVMEPSCIGKGRDYYSLLILLACVEPSMERLRKRNVPDGLYIDIPYRPMERQFQKLIRTGDAKVEDFPWDLDFYSCAIFTFDRFTFIPWILEEPLRIFRNKHTGKTVALYKGGYAFRRDGQLNGASGIWDEEQSFVSIFHNNSTHWIGTYINPAGFTEQDPICLSKEDWQPAFTQGDGVLAIHVPAGPGYTPERLRNSMRLALGFFNRYFPDIPLYGFWSESWLYDPRLVFAIEGKDSNISRMQRQMYLYPIQKDDAAIRYGLFHDKCGDNMPRETSLQRAAIDWLAKGGHFCATSMFIMREDVESVGDEPYQTAQDRAVFRQLIESL